MTRCLCFSCKSFRASSLPGDRECYVKDSSKTETVYFDRGASIILQDGVDPPPTPSYERHPSNTPIRPLQPPQSMQGSRFAHLSVWDNTASGCFVLLVERHTVSPDPARDPLWCAAGWSGLEERKDRRHTELLNSLNSPTIPEDTVGMRTKFHQQCNKHILHFRAREGHGIMCNIAAPQVTC